MFSKYTQITTRRHSRSTDATTHQIQFAPVCHTEAHSGGERGGNNGFDGK